MSQSRESAGFTVTEMTISLAIFMIVSLFAYQIFKADQKSYVEQAEVTGMQQNVRVAIDQVTNDLRIAGSGVPSGGVMSDLGLLHPIDPGNGDNGFPDTVVVFAGFHRVETELAAPMADRSSGVAVEDVSGFSVGSLVIIHGATTDCGESSELFLITGISGGEPKVFDHSTQSPWNEDQSLSCTYVQPSTVILANYRKYYIDDSDPLHPSLVLEEDGQAPRIVADNVENMQLVYDLVTGDRDLPDPVSPGAIRKATVTFVARTNTPDPGWPHGLHSITGEPDHYRRLTLTSDIQIRNLKRW